MGSSDARFVVSLGGTSDPELPNLFLAAGYYGNVLNLADIADQLDGKANCYGLQYRGIREDEIPHESFGDAAKDFLEEIRVIQPEGPYHLGGFSTGGLIAMEIASQLIESGERIGVLTFLDSRLGEEVKFNRFELALIALRGVRQRGGILRAIGRKLARIVGSLDRYNYEEDMQSHAPVIRRSMRVRDAMIKANHAYSFPRLDLRLDLFRPEGLNRLRVGVGGYVDFPDGRAVRVVDPDCGWGPYFSSVSVTKVPGDHGGMLVGPQKIASVLAARLRDGVLA